MFNSPRVHLRLEVVQWRRQCNVTENMRNYRKGIAFVCSRHRSCTAVRDTRAFGQWWGSFDRKREEEGEYGAGWGLRSVLIGVYAFRRIGRESEREALPSAHGMNVQWHVSNTQHACSWREIVVSSKRKSSLRVLLPLETTDLSQCTILLYIQEAPCSRSIHERATVSCGKRNSVLPCK